MTKKRIGGYDLLRVLGRGGMGVVYEARSDAGERVALKTVTASAPDLVDGIRREVRALARVLLHAAWVQIEGQPRVACPLPGDFSAAWQSLGGEPQALQSAFDEPVLV